MKSIMKATFTGKKGTIQIKGGDDDDDNDVVNTNNEEDLNITLWAC